MSLTSFPYFMKSFFSKAEKYSGDSATMISPALTSFSATSGCCIARLISPFSLRTMSRGVPAGAT